MASPSPLNNWKSSISEGKLAELAFADLLLKHMGIKLGENNAENVRAEDYSGVFIADLKYLKKPYPSSPTPSGLTRDEHATLDHANILKYDDNVLIIMVVDYTGDDSDTKGLFFITAGKVKELLLENPKLKYSRSSRSHADKVVKIGVSLFKHCGRIAFPMHGGAETAALIGRAVETLRESQQAAKAVA